MGIRAQAKKVSAGDPILGGSFGLKLLPKTREKSRGCYQRPEDYQGTSSDPNLPQM